MIFKQLLDHFLSLNFTWFLLGARLVMGQYTVPIVLGTDYYLKLLYLDT